MATAVFERQYAAQLTQLAMRRTDFWGVRAAVDASECRSPLAARALTPDRVAELMDTGLCVIDDALGEAEVRAAREEIGRMHEEGELTSVELQMASSVRNDVVGCHAPHSARTLLCMSPQCTT